MIGRARLRAARSTGLTRPRAIVVAAVLGLTSFAFEARAAARTPDDDCTASSDAEPPPSDDDLPPPPPADATTTATTDAAASSSTAAGPQTPGSAAEALGRTPKRVKCLDETLVDEFGRARARKGVQPRYFRKALRVSVRITGGMYAGDLLDTQWTGGGGVSFWITEDFGIDADFKLTPMTYRLERSATSFTGQNRYPDGVARNLAYIAMGHLLWSPIHTKLRTGKDKIIHGDFVLFGGAGPAFHRTSTGVGFDVGMSMYLYPTKFLSVRLDLSDQILSQEIFGSRRLSNNLVFVTGIEFWIPFRLRG